METHSHVVPSQPPVNFKDVAVTFTQEEGQLDLAQRMVYGNMTLETCSHLVSLPGTRTRPMEVRTGTSPRLEEYI
uniref:KRAB domain-containing protein n=2 Tax=Canis lupus familiaris TaxID=9615 RepID=A0A8C0LY55_CANLF